MLAAYRLGGAGLLALMASGAMAQEFDVLIRSGSVFDGTGRPPVVADVAVSRGRIVAVGKLPGARAKEVIDASGMAVTPGFIDPHSHVLESVVGVKGPFLAKQNLAQGVTTSVIGADGGKSPDGLTQLIAELRLRGTSQNHFCYVGHNGVRVQVMGHDQRAATPAEMAEMKRLVREGMQMGCVGLSAGLMYDPGMFSPREEIVTLAKEVAPYDGSYDSHSRDPVNDFLASELETADIGVKARIPAKLGHVKAVGLRNKGQAQVLVARVDALRAQGHDVVADIYPYDGAQANRLAAILVFPGEPAISAARSTASVMTALKAALADPARKAALRAATNNGDKGGFAWVKAVGYDSIRVVDAPSRSDLVGKYISLMAQEQGRDPFDVVADILLATDGQVIVTLGAIVEDDLLTLLKAPWDMISSDGSYTGEGSVYAAAAHPRSSGSFARVLGYYSRDRKLFPLSEAVRKMTSLPADHLRLYDRGRLQPGMAADIAIFDPAGIKDNATFVDPRAYATGMREVLVNGEVVWRAGATTGAAPGRFIPRQMKPAP